MKNRILKFRVWDGKEMFYPDFIRLGWENRVVIEGKKYYEKVVEDSIVQQFTGVIDKNGADVYEGDIIEFDKKVWVSDSSNIQAVRWDFAFCGWSGPGFPIEWHNYGKIIGNIFESPEILLKN